MPDTQNHLILRLAFYKFLGERTLLHVPLSLLRARSVRPLGIGTLFFKRCLSFFHSDCSGETVTVMLNTGTNVNVSDNKNKSTPLQLAVNQGNNAGVRSLVASRHCDVNTLFVQWIAQLVSVILFRWIVIYPVNSAIPLLNNRGLVSEACTYGFASK